MQVFQSAAICLEARRQVMAEVDGLIDLELSLGASLPSEIREMSDRHFAEFSAALGAAPACHETVGSNWTN